MSPITLHYQKPTHAAPAKTGLLVWGVLFLIASALWIIGSGIVFLVDLRLSFGSDRFVFRRLATAATNLMIAVAMVSIGIGSIRRRRWVRPLALAFTGWSCITVALSKLPLYIDSASTMGWWSGDFVAAVLVFAIGTVAPLICFLYFRSGRVVETLETYTPYSTWTDRWSTATLAIGILAMLIGTFSLLNLTPVVLQPLPWDYAAFSYLNSPTLRLLARLIGVLLAISLLTAGLATLRHPTLGWTLALATLTAETLFTVATALQEILASQSPDQAEAPSFTSYTTITTLANIATLLAYILTLLILRKHLPLKPHPLSSPPPREVLPLEPQQP